MALTVFIQVVAHVIPLLLTVIKGLSYTWLRRHLDASPRRCNHCRSQPEFMCGVSGILYKKATSSGFAPIGGDLVKMLESMTHRGKDSSGITVVGEDLAGDLVIRIWTNDAGQASEVLSRAEEVVLRSGGVVNSRQSSGQFLRMVIDYEGEAAALGRSADKTLLESPYTA